MQPERSQFAAAEQLLHTKTGNAPRQQYHRIQPQHQQEEEQDE